MTLPTLLLLYPLLFVLFWAPGLTGSWSLVRRLDLPLAFTLPLGLTFSGLVGYAFFWVYFFSPRAGTVASAAWVIVVLAWLGAAAVWRGHVLRSALPSPDVWRPLLLSALVGLLYLALLFLYPIDREPQEVVFSRAPSLYLAIDNEIPMWFADRLEKGEDPREIVGDWRSSDRPPLQTGMVLAVRSLVPVTGVPANAHYQMLGAVIQCGWVGVFWLLGRLTLLEPRRLAWTLAFLICSAFFYWHSVYVWPKLLAGTLTLTALALVLPEAGQATRPAWSRVALAGLAAGLAMLAHGGAFFTLLGIALYLLRPSLFPGIARTVVGVAAVGLTLLPWILYQKLYDPPGDRLVKWHLAGAVAPDERSAFRALADYYRTTPPGRLVGARIANVLTQFGRPLDSYQHDFSDDLVQQAAEKRQKGEPYAAPADRPWLPWLVDLRLAVFSGEREEAHCQIDRVHRQWVNGQYYHFVRALGLLNLGWLMVVFRPEKGPGASVTGHLLWVAWLSLGVWLLLLAEPGTAVVHHGSFATFMLFFLVLAAALARLPNWACAIVLALMILEWFTVWITHTNRAQTFDIGFAVVAGVSALALAALFHVTSRAAPPSGAESTSPVPAPTAAIA